MKTPDEVSLKGAEEVAQLLWGAAGVIGEKVFESLPPSLDGNLKRSKDFHLMKFFELAGRMMERPESIKEPATWMLLSLSTLVLTYVLVQERNPKESN